MSYLALAQEYQQTAVQLQARLTALRQQVKTAPVSELCSLGERITVLQQEYCDLLTHARILKGYGDLFG